jgi:integrase
MAKALKVPAIKRLKPTTKRREIRDGGSVAGLYLIIQPSGAKSWAARFRRPDGTPAKLTLGRVDLSSAESKANPEIGAPLTLAAARRLAADIALDRARGVDVIVAHNAEQHRRRVAVKEGEGNTFGVLVRKFVDEHARPHTRHWRETARLLGLRYAKSGGEPELIAGGLAAQWSDRPVTGITSYDVYSTIDDATRRGIPGLERRSSGTTSSRGRAMARTLSKLFSWLVEHRKVEVNPCLGQKVPKPQSRDRVLTDAEIKAFWKAASAERVQFSVPLKLLLLTGQRLSEVTGMRRSELSDDGAVWSLPGARTKNHRQHVVPLPPLARAEIASVAATGDFVFSTNGKVPVALGSKIKDRLDGQMRVPPWRLHDLRRTAITGMNELGIRSEVIERVVNHVSGHRAGVAGIYNRSELMGERREALERWATHLNGLIAGRPANVTALPPRERAS